MMNAKELRKASDELRKLEDVLFKLRDTERCNRDISDTIADIYNKVASTDGTHSIETKPIYGVYIKTFVAHFTNLGYKVKVKRSSNRCVISW